LIPDEGFVSRENNYPSLIQGPFFLVFNACPFADKQAVMLYIPLVICVDNPISEDLYPRKIVDVTQVYIVTY
jgi:hypothetical protein